MIFLPVDEEWLVDVSFIQSSFFVLNTSVLKQVKRVGGKKWNDSLGRREILWGHANFFVLSAFEFDASSTKLTMTDWNIEYH